MNLVSYERGLLMHTDIYTDLIYVFVPAQLSDSKHCYLSPTDLQKTGKKAGLRDRQWEWGKKIYDRIGDISLGLNFVIIIILRVTETYTHRIQILSVQVYLY